MGFFKAPFTGLPVLPAVLVPFLGEVIIIPPTFFAGRALRAVDPLLAPTIAPGLDLIAQLTIYKFTMNG